MFSLGETLNPLLLVFYGLFCSSKSHSYYFTLLEKLNELYLNLEGLPRDRIVPTNIGRIEVGNTKLVLWDLGGQVQLGGTRSSIVRQDVERKPIPEHLMTSTSEFIAASLKEFSDQERDEDISDTSVSRRELGFTFSFPMKQTSVTSGILMK